MKGDEPKAAASLETFDRFLDSLGMLAECERDAIVEIEADLARFKPHIKDSP